VINQTLVYLTDTIMKYDYPNQFTIEAHFMSSSPGATLSFYPFRIDRITINRDYAGNFADEIDLNFIISPKDYAILQDSGQNLIVVLTVTYLDKYGNGVHHIAPVQKQYCAMINNPRDIRKSVPDVHLYTEPSEYISVRLIEKTIYTLRTTKINNIFQKASVKDVILAITHMFDIKSIHLVEPDNTHVYDHIDLGSYQGIESIYLYLQSKCGVYTKGINSYFTDGVLYIYPAFDTAITYDKHIYFYQVDTGRYAGASSYHSIEDNSKTVSVVINTQPHSYDLSIAGAENVGTGFMFMRSSRMTDGITTLDSRDGAQFTQDPSLKISLDGVRPLSGTSTNMKYVKHTDNPYPSMSEIAAHQASLMSVTWQNANPFVIDPCQVVKYYYDRNGTVLKKTGIIEQATYRIVRIQRVDKHDIFGCSGDMILRLSTNETVVT